MANTRVTKLQIEILKCMVLNGGLTNGEVENKLQKQHADIHRGFKKLKDEKLIENISSKYTKTKRSIVYGITAEGIKLLIKENPNDALKFWKILIGYTIHNKKRVTESTIRTLINMFKNQYMKYSYKEYSNQIDVLNYVVEKWMNHTIEEANQVSDIQRILEVLALQRGVTANQISKKTYCSISDVDRTLFIHTLQGYQPPKKPPEYDALRLSPTVSVSLLPSTAVDIAVDTNDRRNQDFGDFIFHCLIDYSESKNKNGVEQVYELSLYGIIVVLTLIRRYDMGKAVPGLFFDDLPFPDYIEKIANNYQDKLPLVFGKWDILKRTIKLLAAYNFDIVIDKSIRQTKSNNVSITRGGNAELLDGIKEISSQNSNQLYYFVLAGETIFRNILFDNSINQNNNEIKDKTSTDYLEDNDIFKDNLYYDRLGVVRSILDEMTINLDPAYIFQNYSKYLTRDQQPIIAKYIYEKVLREQEKKLKRELASLYYLNLYFDYESGKRFSHPMAYYSSFKDKQDLYPLNSSPKECLKSIFDLDKKEPFVSLLFKEIISDVYTLSKETKDYLANVINN